MHGHIDRNFVFVKCENSSCCNEFRSKVGKEILGAERRLSSPPPNRNLKGHYNTFLQEIFNEEKIFGDEGQSTAMEKNFGSATFVQIFLSNQQLKEQDIKAYSIAGKNKGLTKNASFTVPLQVTK